ncbi:hypothetical protein HYU40_04760 [Candidatus Woesearchaeota archaeon]|nr:hypothetical protein [Candidatus Woesearchaeota archaeon]
MPSKAQGLSLNTIVIAAIVLIVLLILVGLLTGFFGKKFGPDFRRLSDTSCNGRIVDESQECDSATEQANYAAEVPTGKKCCAKLPPKTCEQLGGSCCSGDTIIRSNDEGCIAKNRNAPNCCS